MIQRDLTLHEIEWLEHGSVRFTNEHVLLPCYWSVGLGLHCFASELDFVPLHTSALSLMFSYILQLKCVVLKSVTWLKSHSPLE